MTRRMNRRGLLKVFGAGAAGAAAATMPGSAWGKSGSDEMAAKPFFFIQMADPQLFWGSQELWATAIGHANRLKPAFVVVCGDLLNRNGNAAKLDTEKDLKRVEAYLTEAKKLDKSIPLYNVAGNHDVCNTPTPETLAWYTKRLGKLWYTFEHAGCKFVVIESDLMKFPKEAPEQAKAQNKWLRDTLATIGKKKYRHKFVFMHHPMALKTVDEKSSYFNMPAPLRAKLLEQFGAAGVSKVFSGHYHCNAIVQAGKIELVTSSSTGKALAKDPLGFRIVKVFADRIEHKYYGYKDLPERVELGQAQMD